MKQHTTSRRTASHSNRRQRHIFEIFLLICLIIIGQRFFPETPTSGTFQEAVLERVVDGDTIYATVDNTSTKIRLIGINTPESVAWDVSRNTPQGTLASDYVKELLPKGTVLYLEYDEEPLDQYDRTLAYVWLKKDADPTSFQDFCEYNLNAVILKNTYCNTMTFAPNDKYEDWFKRIAKEKN